jgi:uncharacterized protein YrzB (UPF0473 family)
VDCKNIDENKEIQAIIQGENASGRNNIQQATNVNPNDALDPMGEMFNSA